MRDLKIALVFLTRLPVSIPGEIAGGELARVVPWFPVAGLVVGAVGGGALAVALLAGMPPLAAAITGLAAAMLTTGALHEDGLADTADALGTGDRERALAIMADSRIGSFGACALIVVIGAKAAALAALCAEPWSAVAAFAACHALSRAFLPAIMASQSPARPGGLAAAAGRPTAGRAVGTLALGAVLALVLVPGRQGLVAVLVTAAVVAIGAWLIGRRFGGCTGDTLGAAQQLAEVAFLTALAARP